MHGGRDILKYGGGTEFFRGDERTLNNRSTEGGKRPGIGPEQFKLNTFTCDFQAPDSPNYHQFPVDCWLIGAFSKRFLNAVPLDMSSRHLNPFHCIFKGEWG